MNSGCQYWSIGAKDQGPGTGTRDQGPGKIKPPTLQMMTVFRKLSPPRGRKCDACQQNHASRNYLLFGAVLTTFIFFQPDQVSKVPFATSPTRAGGQDDVSSQQTPSNHHVCSSCAYPGISLAILGCHSQSQAHLGFKLLQKH